MIVLGADTHTRSHTVAAVAAGTGESLGEQTVAVGRRGLGALLGWARGRDEDRGWALEDCRHVSGVAGAISDRARRAGAEDSHARDRHCARSARQRGKSDPIDALNVARAGLQEGLESFPAAHRDGPELDLRLLVEDRERLVRHRVELNSTLLWHLHDLWPELQLPGGALFSKKTKGSQAQPGRQPQRESARRRSGPSPRRRTSPTPEDLNSKPRSGSARE